MARAATTAASALLLGALASATFIDNTVPRRDTSGAIMDSHDFSIHRYPGVPGYVMVSIAYGECMEPTGQGCDQTPDKCGFQPNHTINVWSSPDLSSGSWTHVTTAVSLANRPPGTIYRPDAIWNPNTRQVVLWFNWLNEAGVYEGYAAYTAPSVAGPYTRVRASVNTTMQNATESCGDFHLFVDPVDAQGYLIAGCGFHMWIERLLPNMLDSAGDTSPTGRYLFSEYFVEAPALFFRNGLYYAIFGHCCCYCAQGSGAIVHVAPAPLGPWTTLGDVACVAPPPPAPATCGAAAEGADLALGGCPGGGAITGVAFASFGTPVGSCAAGWADGACAAPNSSAVVAALCVGRAACAVPASTAAFGDPCLGTVKTLAAAVTCGPPPAAATSPAASRVAAFLAAVGVGVAAGAGAGSAPTPGQGCEYVNASTTSAVRSQQSDIFEVDLADGTTAWVWAGDRWQQSPDGTKAHDPQVWVPLSFGPDGAVGPLRWVDNFTLPVA